VAFTDSWQTYEKEFTVDANMAGANGMKSIAFNMSPNTAAGAYYIDNVVFEVEKENAGGGIPLTPQEKKDTLLYAMDKWIHGMMDACRDEEGNLLVKAWDVVNEPIGGNGQLQHGKADDKDNFFWQDYLGDLDYVRSAVKFARQYGGDDLKLFVNDYNLEYDWDASGNKKLESLISWINKWESDGVTKIDGIGSQMHISCYADATEAQKRKDLIVKSFQMMAETGKLVRISELDMGYVDANGNAVKTVEMTEEQHHQMADFYKWIIQQYKTIIPPAQQWGITLWCATDAPADSGWRPGEPVGIWDQNYYRKHVYAGIADGLSGE
jgi:GH35 family endo-1,4-beta-xylanase